MREHTDHHDAELLLRLYDMRREEKLRRAREWFAREPMAEPGQSIAGKYPYGSEENAYFRMVVTYWEMVASIVNRGLINQELFFENTAEFFAVWEKIKPAMPGLRETFKNPRLWKNLERLAESFEKWMTDRAPEGLDAFRERLKGMAKK